MFEMVDGTGIIGVDMICPLGVSAPQPPNYDRVELEGAGMLVLPNSLDAPLERLELGGKTEQVQTSGKNLANANVYEQGYLTSVNAGDKVSLTQMQKSFTTNMEVSSMQGKNVSVSVRTKEKTGKKYVFTDETDTIITGVFDTGSNNYSEFKNITIPKNAKKLFFSVTYDAQENTELQVELGTTVTTYEPYTGGKPSPSPEYPQEIKNSGKWNEGTQKYEIEVVLSGKNLLDITACEDGKTLDANGNIVNNANALLSDFIPCFSKTSYCRVEGHFTAVSFYDVEKNKIGFINQYDPCFATPDKCRYFRFSLNKTKADYEKAVANVGTALMDYEPHKKPQFLTLTSDRPITKWDKLVEQGGEIGWLYAGVVIDRFDGQSNKISIANKRGDVQNFSIRFENVANGNGNSDIFVDKYRAVQLSYTKAEYGICCNWNDGVKYFSAPNENVATVDEFKAWLVENPLKIAYETTNPEFVPLSESEQNAIRALKTYYPTTVITADGGELDPDIKVTYRKEI
jgi:hypothetical protein|nr:MAG TPA: hypothetical protein [Caudoviricetes sp.]